MPLARRAALDLSSPQRAYGEALGDKGIFGPPFIAATRCPIRHEQGLPGATSVGLFRAQAFPTVRERYGQRAALGVNAVGLVVTSETMAR
jgi:hypothetical protein